MRCIDRSLVVAPGGTSRLLASLCLMVLGMCCSVASSAFAQAPAKDEQKIPEEEVIVLDTKDGVKLTATYYPGLYGKDSVPVVMLHGFKGSRHDFHRLAKSLQSEQGFAVLVPDLRGHGESLRTGDGKRKFDVDRLRLADFRAMAEQDMEAIRRFLFQQHEAERLNVEKLGIVGADMGANVALVWSAYDWSTPPLGRQKQGQYVKALVLLSPVANFKGLNALEALQQQGLLHQVAMYLIVGKEDAKALKDVKRLDGILEKARGKDSDLPVEQRTLFSFACPTSLQGAKMLGQNLDVEGRVAEFLELKLAKLPLPWESLKRAID
jgi:pimeloyl-ACP methyl ester carboxylesterase